MKISVVSPGNFSVPPVVGTSVEHVIQMVASQFKRNHEVIVYTRTCSAYNESSLDGTLRYKRFPYKNSKYYLNQVIMDLCVEKPDVILIENRPSFILPIKEACPGIPLILNMHSAVHSRGAYIAKETMTTVSEQVDALITNSRALQQYFTQKYPAFEGKSHAVHLGIDVLPYQKAVQDIEQIDCYRGKYGISKEDKTILFAGRIKKKKGVHLLLRIMPEIIEKYPDCKLIITGSPIYGGNKNTKYMRKITTSSSRISDHVIFTKFINPYQMPYIYQLADIVVTPSVWNEPFLLVNLEAMASGKPVISSNRGGIPEVVKHGETGLIFSVEEYRKELFDYICTLLESQSLREKYGHKGWERACDFTWEKTASRYLDVFKGLVNGLNI